MNFNTIIYNAFAASVPRIIEVQDSIIRGHKQNENGTAIIRVKSDRTLVTDADIDAQKIIVDEVRKALPGIFAYGEEFGITNSMSESAARFKLVIDPTDGTSNMAGNAEKGIAPAKSNSLALPDNIAALSGDAQKQAIQDAKGWASHFAIQEKQHDGGWKTVASGIYESCKEDAPGAPPKGRVLIAEDGVPGIHVRSLEDSSKNALLQPSPAAMPGIYNFANTFWKEEQDGVGAVMTRHGNREINLGCTSQNMLAVLSGKSEGFFQGHTSLHDVTAGAYLAEKNSCSVAMAPPIAMKKGEAYGTDGFVESEDRYVYPLLIARKPEILEEMKAAYARTKGLNAKDIPWGKGDMGDVTRQIAWSKAQAVIDGAQWQTHIAEHRQKAFGTHSARL